MTQECTCFTPMTNFKVSRGKAYWTVGVAPFSCSSTSGEKSTNIQSHSWKINIDRHLNEICDSSYFHYTITCSDSVGNKKSAGEVLRGELNCRD